MSLVIDLPPELETELAAEAAGLGLPLPVYAMRLLAAGRGMARSSVQSGAELLAYWNREGLIGSRSESLDSPAHARLLREQAQRRERP